MVLVLEFDERFLTTVGSTAYQYTMKVRVRFFFTWINKKFPHYQDILEIPASVFQQYFAHIDKKKMQVLGKNRVRKALHKYLNWYRRSLDIPKQALKHDYDDIFDPDGHKFIETGSTRQETPLTMEQVIDCLKYWRDRDYEHYIYYSILAYSTMRGGAACKILIKNIDLNERKIVTDDKVTKWFGKENAYIIPKGFVTKLESFIEEVRSLRPDQEKLFQYTAAVYRRHIKKWADDAKMRKGWNIDIHPHLFRDATNTLFKENGLTDQEDRCLILIQMPSGVNAQRYLKRMKDFKIRQEIYDRWFPFKDPLP